jgi:hypothetical protein
MLLDEFLQANLTGADAVSWLRKKIGLGARGSREYGRWLGDPSKSDEELGADYKRLQAYFKRLLALWDEVRRSAGRGTRDDERFRAARWRLGRALETLVDLLGDVRLDLVRETFEGGAPEDAELRDLLVRFGRTSTRRWPLSLDWTSESLAGELAYACAELLVEARISGRCPVCGDVWVKSDARGRRKLCDKTSCAAAWRQLTRAPEPAGASTPRVHKSRRKKQRS